MKSKLVFLFIMLMVGFASSYATSVDSLDSRLSINDEIRAIIDYPTYASDNGIEGTVYVRLELMENGKVNVLEAHCTDNELLRYVVDKIALMEFDPAIYKTGTPFNMKFDFKLL